MFSRLLLALPLLTALGGGIARGQEAAPPPADEEPAAVAADLPLPPDIEDATAEDATLTPRVGPLMSLEVDEAIDILDLLHPELAAELRRLREDQPQEVARLVATRFPRIRQMLVLKRTDRKMFDLQVSSLRANRDVQRDKERLRELTYAKDVGTTPWRERWEAARRDLRNQLTRRFDIQHQIRGLEVDAARRKVKQLEELLNRQWEERKARIDEQFDRMIEQEGLELPEGEAPSDAEEGSGER